MRTARIRSHKDIKTVRDIKTFRGVKCPACDGAAVETRLSCCIYGGSGIVRAI